MGLSTSILTLLDVLTEAGQVIDWCIDDVSHRNLEDPLGQEEYSQHIAEVQGTRYLISELVKAKQEPQREWGEELIQKLQALLNKELDEYFTFLALWGIPGVVDRWRKLRAVKVVAMPKESVKGYMRQATTCFLYGLPNATAILCRSLLELVLKEALESRGGSIPIPTELKGLIEFARRAKVIRDGLADKAHGIRRIGIKAAHKGGCSEKEALRVIQETVKVVRCIYGP